MTPVQLDHFFKIDARSIVRNSFLEIKKITTYHFFSSRFQKATIREESMIRLDMHGVISVSAEN